MTLSQQVYDALLNKILGNELRSGELINRRDIAVEFNVSVAPVMEAMLQLETDGLLETIPRKGTRVPLITDEDISGNLLIREALESAATRIVCSTSDRSGLLALRPLAQMIDDLTSFTMDFYKADRHFHCGIVALCKSKALVEEYERITKRTFFFDISKHTKMGEGLECESHVKYLENLIRADPDHAQVLVHKHITSGKAGLAVSV